jgi:hypothetical protein
VRRRGGGGGGGGGGGCESVSVRERWRERRRKRKEGSRRVGCFPLAQIRERDSEERERAGVRERESCCMEEEKREEKMGFWKAPPSRYQQLRSMTIRGPIELKFCREVHNARISIVNGGDRIWSNLQSFSTP